MNTSILNYLKFGKDEDNFFLNKNKKLWFHWADCKETCLAKSEIYKNHSNVDNDLFQFLNRLEDRFIWIKQKSEKIETMNVSEFYNCYLNRSRDFFKTQQLDVSFLGMHGPFISLPLNKLIPQKVYLKYIYGQLIEGNAHFRDFRIRTNEQCIINFRRNTALVDVIQFSSKGILFACDYSLSGLLKESEQLHILLNSDYFIKNLKNINQEEQFFSERLLFTSDSKNTLHAPTEKVLFIHQSLGEKFHFFIPYPHLRSVHFKFSEVMEEYLFDQSAKIKAQL